MAKGEFSLYYLHHIAPVAKNKHAQHEVLRAPSIPESSMSYITEN